MMSNKGYDHIKTINYPLQDPYRAFSEDTRSMRYNPKPPTPLQKEGLMRALVLRMTLNSF